MVCARYRSIILMVTGAMPGAGASPSVRITGGAHGVTAAAARIRVSPQIPDRWMIPLCMP